MPQRQESIDICMECSEISHWFGDNKVLYDVNLSIARGQIAALVGPSGCGKSTLLRAKVGTHPPLQGEVRINGKGVSGPGRDRGIVYQQYSLFPFLTAQENVAFGPLLDQTSFPFRLFKRRAWRELRKQHMEEAAEILHHYGLEKALNLYPKEMSGGMRQRVAIAQAIIMKPQVLLLDEPFGALDEATREDLQQMLLGLYQENMAAKAKGNAPPHTVLMVTHELNEALYVSDRVIGLSQYWNWEEEGHESCPGASIIYDATAPIYHPDDPKELQHFVEQRHEVRKATFTPEDKPSRKQYVRFWDEVAHGDGHGVLAPRNKV